MFWLFNDINKTSDSNKTNDINIFYQIFNNSKVIESNNFICYNAQGTIIIPKKNTKSIIYDIYIKDNLIKYVNKDEERTFIYETDIINSNIINSNIINSDIINSDIINSDKNNLLVFKNSYKKTDNCKLPLLVDSCYDNVYKNIEFKIFELPNNVLQIQSNNSDFIFILSKTPSL
jgi:hypothetical protein